MDRVVHGVYRREVAELNIPTLATPSNVGSVMRWQGWPRRATPTVVANHATLSKAPDEQQL